MFDDTEMTAARAMEPIGGELTGVVHVALADVHGHPHEFTLLLDDADELAMQLRSAVA